MTKSLIYLTLITLLGAFLRLVNVSPFKFYPDSYQSLVVANNIQQYRNVVGLLGNDGMAYPDFFMWTRPLYPLLINLFSFSLSSIQSAQLVSFVCGVAAIPLTYLLIKKVFAKETTALCGSLIMALSFNHTVWSGFIMTETIGTFMMLLLLYLLFRTIKKAHNYFDVSDFVTGLVFALAVFTRYEYVVLLVPIALLVMGLNPTPKKTLINFVISFLIVTSVILSIFYTLPDTLYIFFAQTQILIKFGVIFLLAGLIFVFKRDFLRKKSTEKLSHFLLIVIIFAILFSLLQRAFASINISTPFILSGLNDTIYHDFFLVGLFIAGSVLLITTINSQLLFPILVSVIMLFVVYYRVNPDMFRYFTHLYPFLIIPAAAGFEKIFSVFGRTHGHKKVIIGVILLGIIIIQFITSYNGIKNWRDGEFHQTSYEEKSTHHLVQFINKDDLLLVSLPEPYFMFTKNSVYSIAAESPYIYIGDSLDNRSIIVVQDMGMDKYFPDFSRLVTEKLYDRRITYYFLHSNFLIGNESFDEDNPVRLYRLTVGELKDRLLNRSLTFSKN